MAVESYHQAQEDPDHCVEEDNHEDSHEEAELENQGWRQNLDH